MDASHANDGRMTLVEHLTELRSRLIKCVLAVTVGAVICWIFYDPIFRALIDPYCDTLTDETRTATGALLATYHGVQGMRVQRKTASRRRR